jgi:glutamate/tyrosine decarboxylase-like PLP-dependent enzyme
MLFAVSAGTSCARAGVLHWQSPQFFSWFSGNTSAPGILAEMLIGGLNMIGFSWQSSPVSTELEHVSLTPDHHTLLEFDTQLNSACSHL